METVDGANAALRSDEVFVARPHKAGVAGNLGRDGWRELERFHGHVQLGGLDQRHQRSELARGQLGHFDVVVEHAQKHVQQQRLCDVQGHLVEFILRQLALHKVVDQEPREVEERGRIARVERVQRADRRHRKQQRNLLKVALDVQRWNVNEREVLVELDFVECQRVVAENAAFRGEVKLLARELALEQRGDGRRRRLRDAGSVFVQPLEVQVVQVQIDKVALVVPELRRAELDLLRRVVGIARVRVGSGRRKRRVAMCSAVVFVCVHALVHGGTPGRGAVGGDTGAGHALRREELAGGLVFLQRGAPAVGQRQLRIRVVADDVDVVV
ncbi:hypothetical protein OGATHE_001228 [Ogataea polymorpha]|uniref:Uncharacterized protein n=1 Tax=Ogataea polymorpha TaxID=460523 RepID=A0A9P8PQU9_9ASCO|nr:hypothetical protein OGATHE_001228 [Ogataea polymorpha]